jgi:hypothetical protein
VVPLKKEKKKKSLPGFVDGLGRDKQSSEIKHCTECRALKRKYKDACKALLLKRDEILREHLVIIAPKMEMHCALHKPGVKRRYGSGITRRRWKQNENKKGFSIKKRFSKKK